MTDNPAPPMPDQTPSVTPASGDDDPYGAGAFRFPAGGMGLHQSHGVDTPAEAPRITIHKRPPMSTPDTMKLYEIGDAREILDAWLVESEGELTPEIEALLGEIDARAEEKIERVALYIREVLVTADAVRKHGAGVAEEASRLIGRATTLARQAENLKAYLLREMGRLGKPKVAGLLCTVSVQASPPALKCSLTPEQVRDLVGEEYVTQRIVTSIPTRDLLDRAKAGEPLPDCFVITQGSHVRIR